MANTNELEWEVTVDGTTLKLLEDEGEGNKLQLIRVHLDTEAPAQFELILVPEPGEEQPIQYPGADYKIGAEVKIKMGYKGEGMEELFDGLATRMDARFSELEKPYFHLFGYDRLHLMTRGRYTKQWADVTYADIVSAVAGDFGLSADSDATDETYKHVEMESQSYYTFLQSLAKRTGRQLSCVGKDLLFKKPEPADDAPKLTYGDNLRRARFRSTTAGQAEEVWVMGWSTKDAKQYIGKANTGNISVVKGGTEHGADTTASKFGKGERKTTIWISDLKVNSQADADATAKAVMDDVALQFSKVEAEVEGNPKIVPRSKVEFDGVTDVFNGEWMVIETVHEYTVKQGSGGGYRTKLVAQRSGWKPPS